MIVSKRLSEPVNSLLCNEEEREIHIRNVRRGISLLILGLLLVSYSSLSKHQASAVATGIGINKAGPANAHIGATISYTISVINLGDYWIRNITVTDRFPNGTISTWHVPDLAPLLQMGHQYAIFGIQYTIGQADVLPEQPPHIVNHAEVVGYADVGGLPEPVSAQTDFPTFIGQPPVAYFTVSPELAQTGQVVTFDASGSYDPDGHIVKYEWDWEGDGTYDFDAGTNPIATHTYPLDGTYYPRLRVTDNDGFTNETTRRLDVMSFAPVGGYSVSLYHIESPYAPTAYLFQAVVLAAFTIMSYHLRSRIILRREKKRRLSARL